MYLCISTDHHVKDLEFTMHTNANYLQGLHWFLVVGDKITAKIGNIIFRSEMTPPSPIWKLYQHEKKNVQNLPVSWFYKKYDGIASVISHIFLLLQGTAL